MNKNVRMIYLKGQLSNYTKQDIRLIRPAYTIAERISDYYYEVDYETIDYKIGREYYTNLKELPTGACSFIRVGNLIGRNFDFDYSNKGKILIRTKATEGRHSTIGMGYGNKKITADFLKSGVDNEEYYKLIPFLVRDCMNDNSVYCSINLVSFGDKGYTTGTNPEAKETLCQAMIPRFVCDYASTAKEGVELLKTQNIYAPLGIEEECHVVIADKNTTYIVEFVNNTMVVYSNQDDEYDNIPGEDEIITNFYVDGWNGEVKAAWFGDTKEEIEATGLTPHASGLERYLILKQNKNSVHNMDELMELLSLVKYTYLYDFTKTPYWYSELVNNYSTIDITIYDEYKVFIPLLAYIKKLWEEHKRDGSLWETCYSSVYDLENGNLSVCVGEDYTIKYQFDIMNPGHLESDIDEKRVREISGEVARKIVDESFDDELEERQIKGWEIKPDEIDEECIDITQLYPNFKLF